jgi:hypothetical protein
MLDEDVGQNVDHVDRLELAGDTDRQAFMSELVEHVERPILASIVGPILDEAIGPDRYGYRKVAELLRQAGWINQ